MKLTTDMIKHFPDGYKSRACLFYAATDEDLLDRMNDSLTSQGCIYLPVNEQQAYPPLDRVWTVLLYTDDFINCNFNADQVGREAMTHAISHRTKNILILAPYHLLDVLPMWMTSFPALCIQTDTPVLNLSIKRLLGSAPEPLTNDEVHKISQMCFQRSSERRRVLLPETISRRSLEDRRYASSTHCPDMSSKERNLLTLVFFIHFPAVLLVCAYWINGLADPQTQGSQTLLLVMCYAIAFVANLLNLFISSDYYTLFFIECLWALFFSTCSIIFTYVYPNGTIFSLVQTDFQCYAMHHLIWDLINVLHYYKHETESRDNLSAILDLIGAAIFIIHVITTIVVFLAYIYGLALWLFSTRFLLSFNCLLAIIFQCLTLQVLRRTPVSIKLNCEEYPLLYRLTAIGCWCFLIYTYVTCRVGTFKDTDR